MKVQLAQIEVSRNPNRETRYKNYGIEPAGFSFMQSTKKECTLFFTVYCSMDEVRRFFKKDGMKKKIISIEKQQKRSIIKFTKI